MQMKFKYYGHSAFQAETGRHKFLFDPLAGQFAVLPIGDNFTLGIADAVTAAGMVKAATVFGVRYDTFGYIVVDKAVAKKTFEANGIALLLPGIGKTMAIRA